MENGWTKENVQTLARDLIAKVGGDGYYHGGCARLAIGSRVQAWTDLGLDLQGENLCAKDRLEVMREVLRLVAGWKEIHKEPLPPGFEVV